LIDIREPLIMAWALDTDTGADRICIGADDGW
jgi:hypothetical protein